MDGIELIYIAGYGRSGSTLLDMLLGNHPSVFGGGELTGLFHHAAAGEACSCEARVTECPFWGQVFEKVFRDCPEMDIESAARLSRRVESFPRTSRTQDTYVHLWQATCRAMTQVSGKPIIVDSSKSCRLSARRLPLLAKRLGTPIKVIHLVRDPRAVMWSTHRGSNRLLKKGVQKRLPGGMFRGLVSWLAVNSAVEYLRHRAPALPLMRLRYEDLAGDPCRTLHELEQFLGLNLADIYRRLDHGEPFSAGHGVAGNRMRSNSGIKLRLDCEWQERLPRLARAASCVAWPLMRTYGY